MSVIKHSEHIENIERLERDLAEYRARGGKIKKLKSDVYMRQHPNERARKNRKKPAEQANVKKWSWNDGL